MMAIRKGSAVTGVSDYQQLGNGADVLPKRWRKRARSGFRAVWISQNNPHVWH